MCQLIGRAYVAVHDEQFQAHTKAVLCYFAVHGEQFQAKPKSVAGSRVRIKTWRMQGKFSAGIVLY